MKKYNMINNTLGWLVFVVAAATYLLTIEPTASYWDCPEFVAQAFKSEVGHPPGNPIFILVGRFAANFAGGDVMAVAKCVNAMSALLSAATILLLFWSVTHLVKRLVVSDGEEGQMTLAQYFVVMGSGLCGALAYAWSDTFWFSAVEAEVYAFSSFCTALVFWLILKWENRADDPKSDRWIILIAYVFGFSLGVHLLNLLCIPAIALVFYYRKFKNTNVKGSLITLAVSAVVIVLILWGLEPGFVELSSYFDRFFVNVLGLPFNSGVLFYAALTLALFSWCASEFYKGKNDVRMRLSFFLSIFVSGIPFIGDSLVIPVVIMLALGFYLFKYLKRVPVRIFSNIIMSIFMVFVGFSCYSLIIIRSNANTPLDENSPNTMDALSAYLSRDQYGKTPLLYGPVYTAQSPQYKSDDSGRASTNLKEGATRYARQVKEHPGDPDRYIAAGRDYDAIYPSEMCLLFPRIFSQKHARYYDSFFDVENHPFESKLATVVVDESGNADTRFAQAQQVWPCPSQLNNLQFFLGHQLNYMYFRYFLWNFAGRQNDIQGLNGQMGDVTRGNWISGFNFIDNARLGDQQLLPKDYTTDNKGHNVFYCLPLLLGIIGLLWQAFTSKRGIEQFWVVFFLFFMTGIAIVLYLNQPPLQPRERDYAYAGSFYAFAMWIGMGVAGIWRSVLWLMKRGKAVENEQEKAELDRKVSAGAPSLALAAVAAVIGLAVPLQMVSQTWDDHDRSGRWACHDFGINYLNSLDPNAIIFTNGDNDTFPLWYAQEVEGVRTDVRVVNLSYLATDWYISQMRRAAYKSSPLPMQADDLTYAYGDRVQIQIDGDDPGVVPVSKALEQVYGDKSEMDEYGRIPYAHMHNNKLFIPVDARQAVAAGVIDSVKAAQAVRRIDIDFQAANMASLTSSDAMALDIINASITEGWKRPIYFACTVDSRLYSVYSPYLQNTGMAYQVTPLRTQGFDETPVSNTEKMYRNVMDPAKFRWGNLDKAAPGTIYLDETNRRMVTTTRSMLISLAADLATEADSLQGDAARAKMEKAIKVLDLMQAKLPEKACAYSFVMIRNDYMGAKMAMSQIYEQLNKKFHRPDLHKRAVELMEQEAQRYAQYLVFLEDLKQNHPELSACDQDNNVASYCYPKMMEYYKELTSDNPKALAALRAKIKAMGVNLNALDQSIEVLKAQMRARSYALTQAQMQAMLPKDSTRQPQGGGQNGSGQDSDLQGLPGGGVNPFEQQEQEH